MNAGPVTTLEALAEAERFDSQVALLREHWRSTRHLWINTPDPLKVARFGGDLAPDFWFGAGLPGLAPIRPIRGGRFEFSEGGRLAVIIPAYDTIPGNLDANAEAHVEHLIDLIAVDLDRPERFWRRRGEALVLGAAFLEIAAQEIEPVPVFKTPMSWIRSGGAGIAILDWSWVPELLLGFELIAEDLDLGDRLAATLKPGIWIRRAAA